jgi:hypothetical protein
VKDALVTIPLEYGSHKKRISRETREWIVAIALGASVIVVFSALFFFWLWILFSFGLAVRP